MEMMRLALSESFDSPHFNVVFSQGFSDSAPILFRLGCLRLIEPLGAAELTHHTTTIFVHQFKFFPDLFSLRRKLFIFFGTIAALSPPIGGNYYQLFDS